jgi:hypothetical protein
MSTRNKRPQSAPSAKKKTPPRGSQRRKPRRRAGTTHPAARKHDKELAQLARLDPDAAALAAEILSNESPLTYTILNESLARAQYARQSLDNIISALRQHEPDPANIPALAEVIARAADLLRESAAMPEASPLLDKALAPAARAAVTLAAFVNGPCRNHAPQEHAAARTEAECWPRIHYANKTRNAEADKFFPTLDIGARYPHLIPKQTRTGPAARAFDRTGEALILLLPDALRPGVFPVLPMLLDEAGHPIPPRTAEGKLAQPYLDLAHFLVAIRHTAPDWKDARKKALRRFLEANATAAARQPATVRTAYARTRRRLVVAVRNLHRTDRKPAPAWLRPSSPVCIGRSTSKDCHRVLRTDTEQLPNLAASLLPIYSRTLAELDARAALNALVALRYKTTGRGITGPKSPARDYVAPHLDNLKRLHLLPEHDLRAIFQSAHTEAAGLKPEATPRTRRAKS